MKLFLHNPAVRTAFFINLVLIFILATPGVYAQVPAISVNSQATFCAGGSGATLTASCSANCNGITYTWSPSAGLSATTGATVQAKPVFKTTYTVTATNGTGGTATATSVVSEFFGNGGAADLTAATPPTIIVGFSPQFGISFDFNGDGFDDLAIPNSSNINNGSLLNGSTVSIMLSNGDGTFTTGTPITTESTPVAVTTADFNGDGKVDLVVVNQGPNTISTYLGNGDGTFGAETASLPLGSSTARFVVSGDFNNDGIADIAATCQAFAGSGLYIFLGNGDGTFNTVVGSPISIGNFPIGIVTTDFNGDGNADIAVGIYTTGEVDIFLGNGDGTFNPAPTPVLTVVSHPFVIVTADFNNDGKADLATTSDNSNSISVLLGDGNGGFNAGTSYTVGSEPVGMTYGDYNGDGNLDLVTANHGTLDGTDGMTILLGDGAGNFGSAENFTTGTALYGAMSGDFNGDGELDLAVDNTGAGASSTSIFLNTTPSLAVSAGSDASICKGAGTNLSATGGTSYLWSPSAGLSSSTIANPMANPTITTTYIVSVSNGSCAATDSVVVTVTPGLQLSISPLDTTICRGSVVFHSSGAGTYQWSPSTGLDCSTCANPTATPLSSTTYIVSGSNGSCSTTDTVILNIGLKAVGGIITDTRDTICQGTGANLTLTGNSSNIVQWQSATTNLDFTNIAGAVNTTTYKTAPLQQTTWFRVAVDSGNCGALSDTVKLFVPQVLQASFYSTQTAAKQLTFNSDSSLGNIRGYHWDFGDGQTSAEQDPVHTYAKDSTYYVCLTLYDGSNCSYTFCSYKDIADAVRIVSNEGNWMIYPNPFSDQLTISGKQNDNHLESIEMYDVLGQLVINKNFGNARSPTVQLSVSALSEGVYYLLIKTANASFVQKVVK